MDLILRLVLAILGTCILLYLSWLIYLLRSHPWALWKMNNHRYFSASGKPVTLRDKFHEKLTYLKIFMIIFLPRVLHHTRLRTGVRDGYQMIGVNMMSTEIGLCSVLL